MHTATSARSRSRLLRGAPLEGVQLRPFQVNADARGTFTEVFCDHWGLPIAPVQWSLVRSEPRVLRGMHLHWNHDEYVAVVQGTMVVGLHDLRAASPSRGLSAMYELRGDDPCCLAFPAGLVHGWYAADATLHLQAVSESHRDYDPYDNLGCHFADPALDLPWPDPSPVVSERAAAFGPLSALRT